MSKKAYMRKYLNSRFLTCGVRRMQASGYRTVQLSFSELRIRCAVGISLQHPTRLTAFAIQAGLALTEGFHR